jgi:hypothetical protein
VSDKQIGTIRPGSFLRALIAGRLRQWLRCRGSTMPWHRLLHVALPLTLAPHRRDSRKSGVVLGLAMRFPDGAGLAFADKTQFLRPV